MNLEITRQYEPPQLLSTSTTSIVKQFKSAALTDSSQGNNPQRDSIPDSQDLLNIKQNLQGLLPITKDRLESLQTSIDLIEKNVKINETDPISSGKNINAILEQTKIKQETGDINEVAQKIPKEEQNRQVALETLKRRKRREETQSPDSIVRRSESPHHTVKLKILDNHSMRSSASPSPKPKQINEIKKKMTKKKQKTHQPAAEEVDFVRVKPKDQVPIATFWSALEPYFRNLTEEDREFLLEKSDQGKPYLIPPLGQHYLEKWAEEDMAASINTMTNNNSEQHKLRYLANPHDISDPQLLQNDIGGGSLTERLISSLVVENILTEDINLNEDEEEDDPDIVERKHTRTMLQSDPPAEVVDFEERLRRELRYVGLFSDEDVDWNAKEDDEICAELRSLGQEFKEQAKINDEHKKRLLEIVDCQLQYEQYRQVLDTLDSQVEQGYLKRFRPQKAKKRKTTGPRPALSENTVHAMEKRKTWIDALGSIFKDKNMNMPQTSIYENH
jgi:hypothetical protein